MFEENSSRLGFALVGLVFLVAVVLGTRWVMSGEAAQTTNEIAEERRFDF